MADSKRSYDQISSEYFNYAATGTKTVKVSDTVSSMSIVGKDNIGGIASALTKVTFGSNIAKIDEYCCVSATNLTSVTPAAKTLFVADHAFEHCANLTSYQPFTNGSKIYCVGNYAFAGTKLKNVKLNLQSDNSSYDYQGCIVTDKDHGPYAGRYAFANCKNLESIEFLKSTELGPHMFDGCSSLKTVNISSNNLSGSCVGEYVFANCTSLSSIKFPYRFEVFSQHMFDGCTNLTSIQLQNPPATDSTSNYFVGIEDYAFNNCKKLTSLSIPEQVSNISLFDRNCLAGSNITSVYLKGMLSTEFDSFYRLSTQVVTKTEPVYSPKGKYPVGTLLGNEAVDIWAEAQKTNIPVVIWLCGPGCGMCTSFKNTCYSALQAFIKDSPYYFVYFYLDNSENVPAIRNFIWSTLKNGCKTWQNHDRSFIGFVAFFYLWKKQDGTVVMECPDRFGGRSVNEVDTIKNRCKNYFAGFQLDESKLVATSTKTTTTTQQIIITEESFNGWGVGHPCDFYTKDGMRFHFDPTEKLSATTDGHLRQLIGGDATTITFTMLGNDGKTYNNTISCIVASNAEIDQIAPNMHYIGASTKADPATVKVDTGRYNLCGKVIEYTYNQFTSWGTTGTAGASSKVMKANYTHPSGRGGMQFIYYNNFGQIGQIEGAEKQGTTTKCLADMDYVVPESIDDIDQTYLMNDCLKAAMTNVYNKYSTVDPGEEPDDGTPPEELPYLMAWIKISITAAGKYKIKAIRPGASILSRCTDCSKSNDFMRHYIPWFSNYDSTYNSKELIRVNSKGKITIRQANDKNAIANCIYFDRATKSYGIKLKGSTDTLIAYGCLGQYFPCDLHGATGKVKSNLTVPELMANRLAAYVG